MKRWIVVLFFPILLFTGSNLPAHSTSRHRKIDTHVDVGERVIRADLHIRWNMFTNLIERPDLHPMMLSREDKNDIRRELEKLVRKHFSVEVNGMKVDPVVRRISYTSNRSPILVITLAYRLTGPLDRVTFGWDFFMTPDGSDPEEDPMNNLDLLKKMPMELHAEDQSRNVMFTPNMRSYTWYASGTSARYRISPATSVPDPVKIRFSVLSLGMLLFALVLLLAPGRNGRIRMGCALLLAGSAIGCHIANTGVAEVQSPWQPEERVLTVREAEEIFSVLHRNVYRAFDYRTEGEIYDTLARSCRGDHLEEVYLEIIQGFNPSGKQKQAKTEVMKVEILEKKVTSLNRESATFTIRCRWRVYGTITHWEHTHSRTNEYRAEFTVNNNGRNWKISDIQILQQKRLKM